MSDKNSFSNVASHAENSRSRLDWKIRTKNGRAIDQTQTSRLKAPCRWLIVSIMLSVARSMNLSHRVKSDRRNRGRHEHVPENSRGLWKIFSISCFGFQLQWFSNCFRPNYWVEKYFYWSFFCGLGSRADNKQTTTRTRWAKSREGQKDFDPNSCLVEFIFTDQRRLKAKLHVRRCVRTETNRMKLLVR